MNKTLHNLLLRTIFRFSGMRMTIILKSGVGFKVRVSDWKITTQDGEITSYEFTNLRTMWGTRLRCCLSPAAISCLQVTR